MTAEQFTEKFIAFVDILGFTRMVEASEAEIGPSLTRIIHHDDFFCLSGKPA